MRVTPPAARLSAAPVVETLDDAARGLEELAWIAAEESRLAAECERLTTDLRRTFAERMTLDVEGSAVTFAGRRAALEEAIAAWAAEARETILDGAAKSRKFTHGVIGWRKAPDAVGWIKGHSDKTLRDGLEKAHKLFSKLGAVLGKCFPFRKKPGCAVPAETLFELKLSPNRTVIKQLLADGKIGAPQLRELGLELVPGEETFYLDVSRPPARSEVES